MAKKTIIRSNKRESKRYENKWNSWYTYEIVEGNRRTSIQTPLKGRGRRKEIFLSIPKEGIDKNELIAKFFTDRTLGMSELHLLFQKKLTKEPEIGNSIHVLLDDYGKLWRPVYLEERATTKKLDETLKILTGTPNEIEFHQSGLSDILDAVPDSLSSLYRISVVESILYSWDRRLRAYNYLRKYPDINCLTVGSCARFEAQHYSDLEYVLISKNYSIPQLKMYGNKVNQYLINRFKMKKNDRKVGTPEKIVQYAYKADPRYAKNRLEFEERLIWALTPILDGYPLNNLSFPFDKITKRIKRDFKRSLLSIGKIKEEELYNWGARRFLTSARDREKTIKATRIERQRVKAIHHATSFSIRALTLLYVKEESQKPQHLPYWLAPRFLENHLPSNIETENIRNMVLTAMMRRRTPTKDEKKILFTNKELLQCLRQILEEVEKNLPEKFLKRE